MERETDWSFTPNFSDIDGDGDADLFLGEDALDLLEYDVKAYFALGGAMHDAAIAAWGIKGYYDYIRPISSLRAMADRGQSSAPDGASYHVDGIPLRPGYIERVDAGDALAGDDGEHLGKIKFRAWRGQIGRAHV